jgi:hypothetical protein
MRKGKRTDMKFLYIKKVGVILLLWFLVSTLVYIFTGQFIAEIDSLPEIYEKSGFFGVSYYGLRICSTLLMFAVIPLTLKGRLLGLYAGLTYVIVGFKLNPFQYLLPKKFLIVYEDRYFLPVIYSRIWGLFSLIAFIFFFIYMRKRSNMGVVPDSAKDAAPHPP